MRRIAMVLVGLAMLLGLVVWGAWPRAPGPLAPADRPHVVLISIDTLRADHLGAYGSERVATPHIDALAEQGVLFEQHLSASNTTLNAHTSLLTGLWPLHHGVPRNGFVVHDGLDTLAEVLGSAGYRTAAFLGAKALDSRTGIAQGFAYVDQGERGADGRLPHHRDGPVLVREVRRWLAGQPGGEPLFLFVHLFDVHWPYEPPGRYLRQYDVPDLPGVRDGSIAHVRSTRRGVRQGDPEAARHSAVLRARYAAGVSWVDDLVGDLLADLEAAGVLDDAVVVLTSDHGEVFDDRPDEVWNHGYTLYDEAIRVPLVVRLPGGEQGGRRVAGLVSGVDVFPTVLDLVGVEGPAVDGRSLAPALRGQPFAGREVAFAEATKPWTRHHPRWLNHPRRKVARSPTWALHWDPAQGGHALYDLRADPGERVDRWSRPPPAAGRVLDAHLRRWVGTTDPAPTREVGDEDLREALRALGYTEGE